MADSWAQSPGHTVLRAVTRLCRRARIGSDIGVRAATCDAARGRRFTRALRDRDECGLTGECAWRSTTRSSRTDRSGFPTTAAWFVTSRRWAKVRGDKLAYRFLDFSTERDGVARDLNWADFGVRNRAVGARLQQVTEPGDRVAILCPQNLEYLVAFFGTLYSGRIAVPLFDPSRARPRRPAARRPRRLPPVGDPDHHRGRRGRPQVLPQPAGQGTPARHRRRRGARRGRRHLGAGRRRTRHHRLPAVHLRLDPHPDRRADHPPEPGHQRGAGDRGAARARRATAASPGCRSSTTWV